MTVSSDRQAAQRPLAVLDIDGVLADVRHRLHHVRSRPKDWAAFFAAAPGDFLLAEGSAVAGRLAADHEIVYVSGRPERCRRDTLEWLSTHGLPAGRLMLRRDGDRRPARQVKLEVVRGLAQAQQVVMVVDDDPEVCAEIRTAGLVAFQATWMQVDRCDNSALSAAREIEGLS